MQSKTKKYEQNSCGLNNGSNYDYHLVIKVLPEEFQIQFECLAESTKR